MSNASYTPGHFVWRELMTTDVAKARTFYGGLFGWTFDEMPMGETTYTMVGNGGKNTGGIMSMHGMPKGAPPHWLSYVSVKDVDASAAKAKAEGGQIAAGPNDIPDVGRFAVVGDPDGAYLAIFKSHRGDAPSGRPGLGAFCWETLSTNNIDRARSFYRAVVGWTMGAGPGDVQVFSAGDAQVADVQMARSAPPSWTTYVVVQKIEDANARVAKLGGKVVMPLVEVPEVGRISLIADPTGAHLGLFEPKMA